MKQHFKAKHDHLSLPTIQEMIDAANNYSSNNMDCTKNNENNSETSSTVSQSCGTQIDDYIY